MVCRGVNTPCILSSRPMTESEHLTHVHSLLGCDTLRVEFAAESTDLTGIKLWVKIASTDFIYCNYLVLKLYN